MSHTPKPWGITPTDDARFKFILFDRDKVIARVSEADDAALLKVAPELLESLDMRINELEVMTDLSGRDSDFRLQLEANLQSARALRAKAKGEIS